MEHSGGLKNLIIEKNPQKEKSNKMGLVMSASTATNFAQILFFSNVRFFANNLIAGNYNQKEG